MGVDDERAPAHRRHRSTNPKTSGSVEVVQDPKAEDEVELAVRCTVEVAHVAEPEVDVEPERPAGEAGLLEIRLTPFDRHDLRAAPRELERVHPLEAGEVEHSDDPRSAPEEVGAPPG